MTETSTFYSGTSTDTRSYTAADWAAFFRTFLGAGGVVHGKLNALAVSAPGTGMTANVATGHAWVYGYYVKSTAVEAQTIEAADGSNPRIDRIILRNTFDTGITIEVLKGIAAAEPAAPDVTTTGGSVYEISLAQVLVGTGVETIAADKVTDERSYATLQYVRQSSLVHPAALDLGGEKITNLGDGVLTTDLMTKQQFDASANFSLAPSGVVRAFGTASVPAGFLLCDGSAVSRTTYAALFAAIGTAFGAGDGSTTFNIPDMDGRFVFGYDSTDEDFDTVGETGGAATVSLTEENLPVHLHGGVSSITGASASGLGGEYIQWVDSGANTGSTGSGTAHNNLPPYVKLAWGIRV